MQVNKTCIDILPFRRLTAPVLIAAAAAYVFASPSWGSAEGAFSATDHDARGLAMGGACIALADGDAAARWNPARLPYLSARSVTAAHGDLIEGLPSGLTTISCAVPWGDQPRPEMPYDRGTRWAVGVFLSRLGLDEIADTASWTETAISGSLARTFLGYVSAGFSIRYLNVGSDIDQADAHGMAADLALSAETTDRTRAALVIRNAVGRLTWQSGERESLPTLVDFALSYSREEWLAGELAFHFDGNGLVTTSIGLETSPVRTGLTIWAGLKRYGTVSSRNVPSFGVGVPAAGFMIGYGASFDEGDGFGTTQRLSVSATF
jgi:hypothetical protein